MALEFLGYVQFCNSATVMQKLQNCLLWLELQAGMIISFLTHLGTVFFFLRILCFIGVGGIKKSTFVGL